MENAERRISYFIEYGYDEKQPHPLLSRRPPYEFQQVPILVYILGIFLTLSCERF